MAKSDTNILTESKDVMRDHFEALLARKAEIEAISQPKRDARQLIHDKINALTVQAQALDQEIDQLERPELIPLMDDISKVARILGGKAMSDNVQPEEVA